jgi:hypothetical protein
MKELKYCHQCYSLKKEFPIILKKEKKICTDCYSVFYGTVEVMELQRKKTLNKKKENRILRNQNIILNKLKEGCFECGEKNYLCLDLIDEMNNIKNVTIANRSVKLINEQIKDCRIICSNCLKIKSRLED